MAERRSVLLRVSVEAEVFARFHGRRMPGRTRTTTFTAAVMYERFTASVMSDGTRVEITFANRRTETSFATDGAHTREYGADRARRSLQRLTQLHAASNLEVMRNLPGRCHELHGDRAGQLAVDVTRNYRLIFRPTSEPSPTKADGGLGWSGVEAITIIEVEDYHGG